MIYFLQGETTRKIKIGFTNRLIRSRIMALQIGSPDRLVFLGAHPGDEHTERDLHQKFKATASHGEWHTESVELLQYINDSCITDMDVAHSADSLVAAGVISQQDLGNLDHKAINSQYISYLSDKLW